MLDDDFTIYPRPVCSDANDDAITDGPASGALVITPEDDEWFTPPSILDRVRATFGGEIELDPFSCAAANKNVRAERYFTDAYGADDEEWECRNLYMNPPYSRGRVTPAVYLFLKHWLSQAIGEAIVVVNNGTETGWAQALASNADCVCFPSGRIRFWKSTGPKGSGRSGQAVYYFGQRIDLFVAAFKDMGVIYYT